MTVWRVMQIIHTSKTSKYKIEFIMRILIKSYAGMLLLNINFGLCSKNLMIKTFETALLIHILQKILRIFSSTLRTRLFVIQKIEKLRKIFFLIHRSKGLTGLKEKYAKNSEDLKIDRIMFIASATSPLPKHLMRAVWKIAREEDRGEV